MTVKITGGGLVLLSFGSGAAIMALEVAGSRVLAPWFGSSVVVWGSLIGVFLGAAALGAAGGGILADRRPRSSTLAGLLGLSALLTAAVPLATTPVLSLLTELLTDVRGLSLAGATVLFAGPCAALGAVPPLALKLSGPSADSFGRTAGRLAAASTAGGILGALGASFIGIPLLSTTQLIAAVACFLAMLSLVAALAGRSLRAAAAATVCGLSAVFVLCAAPAESARFRHNEAWSPAAADLGNHQDQPPGQALFSTGSTYQKIDVWELPAAEPGYQAQRFLLLNGAPNGLAAVGDGRVLLDSPPAVSGYIHAFLLLPALRPQAATVLFIGLGAGTGPMALSRRFPRLAVEAVELDAEVVRTASEWFGFDHRLVPVRVGDGRACLAGRNERWDIIIVDAYRGDALPFHLLTLEYASLVRDHLSQDGLAVLNLPGALEGPDSRLLQAAARTWRAVLPNSALWPVPSVLPDGSPVPPLAGADERRRPRNIILVLSAAPLPSPEVLRAGIREEDYPRPGITRLLAASLLEPGPDDGGPLLTDDYAPVDLLVAPPR